VTGGAPVILVVENDAKTRRFVSATLSASGYGVLEASSAAQGIELTSRHRPDVVVVDLDLPDANGSEVARRIRQWSQVPIIAISSARDEAAKTAALGDGANEYLSKPFGTADLMGRVRAALRGGPSPDDDEPGVVDLGDEIHIDLPARTVLARGKLVHLTPIEFKLLGALVEHVGAIVTYRSLLAAVWGPGYTQQVQSLRVHMTQLRQKLEREPRRPKYLSTETGIGYRLRTR
jgi:two-component system KDP operon response regulator KdpE